MSTSAQTTTSSFVTMNLAEMKPRDRYFLMTACIVPRPIALVTTWDAAGKVLNAAPFSYFNGVSSDPALIMLGLVGKPSDAGMLLKDTTRNIVETGEFVINVCTVPMADIVEQCAEPNPPEVSEVELLKLETIPSTVVKPPRLAVSPIHMECRLYESIQIGKSRATLILGEVLLTHVRPEVMDEKGRVDVEKVNPLARLNAGNFGELGRYFRARH